MSDDEKEETKEVEEEEPNMEDLEGMELSDEEGAIVTGKQIGRAHV